MKRKTSLITLLAGALLGAILLVASMLSTTKTPASSTATASPSVASTGQPSPSPSGSVSTPAKTWPARAKYLAKVTGGHKWVAIMAHGKTATAYVCTGSVVDARLHGPTSGGRMTLSDTGGGQLSATYDFKEAVGNVLTYGARYNFTAPRFRSHESIRDLCQDHGQPAAPAPAQSTQPPAPAAGGGDGGGGGHGGGGGGYGGGG